VGFHTFYGKFRLTMDQVLYFDHYVTAGGGWMELNTNSSPMGVVGTGFVFWLGRNFSVRAGLKDYIFQERRVSGQGIAQHLLFHADVGFVFGGG
jgi:outer membrane beta-barrel protein